MQTKLKTCEIMFQSKYCCSSCTLGERFTIRDRVFSQSDKEMIEDTRLITDLKTTAVRIKLRGAILISNIERAKYTSTLRKIIPSVKDVPDETIIL